MAATKQDLRYDHEIAARIAIAFDEAFGDLTEVDAGKVIGTHQTQVGRYRKGVSQIPFRVFLQIAEKLKRGLDEIVQPGWAPVDLMVRIREQSIAIEALRRQLAEAEKELSTLRAANVIDGARGPKVDESRLTDRVKPRRLRQQVQAKKRRQSK